MKRNHNLETLSWEHHDGLVIASRIQRGLSNKTDWKIISEYIVDMWEKHLKAHFRQEEDILNPVLVKNESSSALIEKVLEDHSFFDKTIHAIKKGNKRLPEYLREFSVRLIEHIRFEEKEYFTFIEENIDETILDSVGKELHAAHTHGDKGWNPEFWK
ncbi:MAG: hemerythrin domain-containing protein [Calditrichaceae bacterium]